jgi:hypothetical protein
MAATVMDVRCICGKPYDGERHRRRVTDAESVLHELESQARICWRLLQEYRWSPDRDDQAMAAMFRIKLKFLLSVRRAGR